MRVSGELEAAGSRVPLGFDASVRLVDANLELELTTTVDQSRLGMATGRFATYGGRRGCA